MGTVRKLQNESKGKNWKTGVTASRGRVPRDLHWGKAFWILEQLRAKTLASISDYFKTKCEYVTPERIKKYDANNTIAIVSIAMRKDMFPWFKSSGFQVDCEAAEIKENSLFA